MNPYANTSGFVDLLTSQQETSINVADSVSPSLGLGESDALVFSTQWCEAALHGETTNTNRIP